MAHAARAADDGPVFGASGAAIQAEAVLAALDAREWAIRQGLRQRRAHLFLILGRSGTALMRGDVVELATPALLWLPADGEATVRFAAGASGHHLSIREDVLARTIASAAEAVHLRRTVDRFVLIDRAALEPALAELAFSCEVIERELRSLKRGASALILAHIALIAVLMWRLSAREGEDEGGLRGGGSLLVERFRQLVELHCRDGWAVARYAGALGVTTDRLHAACLRIAGAGPRALVHRRLVAEACTRLEQQDTPVEQIGFGLGFRDPGYFSRFFRRHVGVAPGEYRRKARAERARKAPSFAAWP